MHGTRRWADYTAFMTLTFAVFNYACSRTVSLNTDNSMREGTMIPFISYVGFRA